MFVIFFLQIVFLFIFMTQDFKKNMDFRNFRICVLQLLFINVFVHQKKYSLHLGQGRLYKHQRTSKLNHWFKIPGDLAK